MGTSNSMLVSKGTVSHPRFKQVRMVESKGVHYLEVYVAVSNEYQTQQFKLHAKHLDKFNQQNILSPIDILTEDSTYCGTVPVLKLVYPYYPFSLELEISDRRLTNTYFKMNQLWYLLGILVNVGKQFQREGMRIGDVRPHNILLNKEGEIKIVTQYTVPLEEAGSQSGSGGGAYLAPEQLEMVHTGSLGVKHLRAEVFSAALTILQVATLYDIKSIYNNNQIDFRSLGVVVDRLRSLTHPLFAYIIGKMLISDVSHRPYFHQIGSLLSPYMSFIKESEPFTPHITISMENLRLYHECFNVFKSTAFLDAQSQSRTNRSLSPNVRVGHKLGMSQRLRTQIKRPLTKPFISAKDRSPFRTQTLSQRPHVPLYQQNYYKLKQLERRKTPQRKGGC